MRSFFRRTVTLALIFGAALSFASCAKPPQPVTFAPETTLLKATAEDKNIVVAKVNGAEITNYALKDMMNRIALMNEQAPVSEPKDSIRKKALDQLILQELALQQATRQGLRVEDALIDRTMEQFIAKLGHEDGYKKHLEENHMTSVEFRTQVERSLVIQRILVSEVIRKISVTDDDMKKEYGLAPAEFRVPEKVTAIDITVPLKQGEQAALKRAQELLTAIKADKDKDASHLVSDATFSVRNIDLKKEEDPALYEAARKLKPGELSGAIAGKDAIHLLKLTEYTPERQKSYEEARSSIEEKLKTAAFIKRRLEWEQELKKDAKIEVRDTTQANKGN